MSAFLAFELALIITALESTPRYLLGTGIAAEKQVLMCRRRIRSRGNPALGYANQLCSVSSWWAINLDQRRSRDERSGRCGKADEIVHPVNKWSRSVARGDEAVAIRFKCRQ